MVKKTTTKKTTAKKTAATKPETPAADDKPEVTEPKPKAPAPAKEKTGKATDEDYEAMANVFESSAKAIGDPTPDWTKLQHKHVENNMRYAEICRSHKSKS